MNSVDPTYHQFSRTLFVTKTAKTSDLLEPLDLLHKSEYLSDVTMTDDKVNIDPIFSQSQLIQLPRTLKQENQLA